MEFWNELYRLSLLNKVNCFNKSTSISLLKHAYRKEQQLKNKLARILPKKAPLNYFDMASISVYKRIEEDFKYTNNMLAGLGMASKEKLIKYKYTI